MMVWSVSKILIYEGKIKQLLMSSNWKCITHGLKTLFKGELQQKKYYSNTLGNLHEDLFLREL